MRRIFLCFLSMLLIGLPIGSMAEKTDGGRAVLLVPQSGSAVLEERNAAERYSVAGLSKLPAILTLCHAFDADLIDPNHPMEVSKKASRVSGPTAFLEAGETVEAGELMKAAVMISAGDAIWTLMENAFGSEEVFLQNIGVILKEADVDLTLTTCLGTGTLFSCEDLIRLGRAAAESKTFLRYAGLYMDSLRHENGSETELVNANRMIRTYAGCVGLLTGSSREDGYCGVFMASRSGMTYLCCVIGSATSDARFAEATRLFDFAFTNYRLEQPATNGEPMREAYPVQYGEQETVDLVPHETVSFLLKKADGGMETAFDLPEALSAPLDPDTAVGSATFTQANGTPLGTVLLYPAEAVRSNGFSDVLRRLLTQYLC